MKSKLWIIGFSLSMFMSGCVIYNPQMTDIPLIAHKGDLRADAGISILTSAHASVSYGLTDKIAIQGFGSIGADERHYLQGAAGIYKNTGNNKVLEAYTGFGYGHGESFRSGDNGFIDGNYQLYFGQVNYGKTASEKLNFETGISLKAGYLHTNLTDKNYYGYTSDYGPYRKVRDESILFEPAAFIRMGGKNVRFSLKLGSTFIHKFTNTGNKIPYSYFNLGLGINYRL